MAGRTRSVVAAKRRTDLAAALVEQVMSAPIPTMGELIQSHKNTRGQLSMRDVEDGRGDTADASGWTARQFVDYFARKWHEASGGNYKKTYRSDQVVFADIGKFMASNGLPQGEWTKKFVDWCFERRAEITRKETHFLPQTIRHYLNHFYQEVVMPQVEEETLERSHYEVPILEEIEQADREGKANLIFLRFGIPVASTYFIVHRGFKPEVVERGLGVMIDTLATGGAEDRNRLGQMFQRSIIRAPYPDFFEHRNWRERWAKYTLAFQDENWWREKDYRGKPLPQYAKLQAR